MSIKVTLPVRLAAIYLGGMVFVLGFGSAWAYGGGSVVVFLLAAGTAAGFGVLATVLLRRPIADLVAQVRAVAKGDSDRRAIRPPSDDFAELATAINEIAGRLQGEQAALGSGTAQLEAVLESMSEGVMVTDRDGRIRLWNDAFAQLFPDVKPHARLPIEVVRSSALQDGIGRATASAAPVSVTLDLARDRSLIARIAPIARDGAGIVAVFHDVTELRRAERTRRDFLANVSHELRTPIATIRAAAETLTSDDERTVGETRRFLDMILRQSERMAALVGDMLRLSEIESSYEPKRSLFDLAPLVEEILSGARARFADRAPRLEKDLAPEIRVWADRDALDQILTNLVDNACKHTRPDGQVTVAGHEEANGIVLEVADTGTGIGREHIPRLFERFYRIDRGRGREDGGGGLGLAIVRHLVLAHRGEIGVESEPGKGTIIRVRLSLPPKEDLLPQS